ncbi:hypothetical protein E3N88_45910 [Mikania micrantha]|uniref:CCHC-type domain-containing protein n=1 Tax=Mikania micrantha TaxID=192012 RepID=A0A5N6L835_9ASTR|nr:hypothetical protein E3N88_45910 [Mikania micrantha]
MLTPAYKHLERYIEGLTPQVRDMVLSADPTTLRQAVYLAHELTDTAVIQGLLPSRGSVIKTTDNKRKWDNPLNKTPTRHPPGRRKFGSPQNYPPLIQNTQIKGAYVGKNPRFNNCDYHHRRGPCERYRCQRCGKLGHAAEQCRGHFKRDCPHVQNNGNEAPKRCFECGKPGHIKKDCPHLKNNNNNENNNGLKGRALLIRAKETINDLNLATCSFEVEVGMDWLSKNHAEITCHDKDVRMPLPSGETLDINGERSDTPLSPYRLTKSAHFLAIKENDKMERLARIYVKETSVTAGKLTYHWWSSRTTTAITLASKLRPLRHSMEGNADHLSVGQKWATVSSLARNSYMKQPRRLYRSEIVLAAARDHQKMPKAFGISGRRQSPSESFTMERRHLFCGTGKTKPTVHWTIEILKRIGPVAYPLNLPAKLDGVHNIFHVSNLMKFLSDEILVIIRVRLELEMCIKIHVGT